MQIAERVYSLAQEQDDAALLLGAYSALACTHYFLGNFETSRQFAMRGTQIWRSGNVQSYAEDFHSPVVNCLIYGAMCEWHLGELGSSQANMGEAISLAKELNDINALAVALSWAAGFAHNERNPAEVDRFASDLIELSTRHNFAYWLATGSIFRGWARSASGSTAEGIPWIEQGIRDIRAAGTVLSMPAHLARKAEALHLADRSSEALEAISEAEALAEKFEQLYWCAELHRLRGVFLAAIGAEETQI
jgi:adenylate cyclase